MATRKRVNTDYKKITDFWFFCFGLSLLGVDMREEKIDELDHEHLTETTGANVAHRISINQTHFLFDKNKNFIGTLGDENGSFEPSVNGKR